MILKEKFVEQRNHNISACDNKMNLKCCEFESIVPIINLINSLNLNFERQMHNIYKFEKLKH